jgi:vacuolar-type H+-ATPase subunit F/Vma7
MLEAQVRPLVVAIPRFIQLGMPLPPLKPMAQSRRGVTQMLEAQVHPLVVAIPLPEGAPVPPASESPHAVIEPSALRAAKAPSVE